MTAKELRSGNYSLYDRVIDITREAHAEGSYNVYVGREFYKDEHEVWLDKETLERLEADGFSVEFTHNHEWKITW